MIARKGDVQYMLRLPVALRERVKARAADNGRSMNTEVIAAIERHLVASNRLDELEARVTALERR